MHASRASSNTNSGYSCWVQHAAANHNTTHKAQKFGLEINPRSRDWRVTYCSSPRVEKMSQLHQQYQPEKLQFGVVVRNSLNRSRYLQDKFSFISILLVSKWTNCKQHKYGTSQGAIDDFNKNNDIKNSSIFRLLDLLLLLRTNTTIQLFSC